MKIRNFEFDERKVLSMIVAFGLALCSSVEAKAHGETNSQSATNTSNISATFNNNAFNDSLRNSSIISQTDEKFEDIPYKNNVIRSAGCGPVSIVNALTLAFNIPSEYANTLLSDVMALDSRYRLVYDYMLERSGNNGVHYLDKVIDGLNGTIIDGGSSFSKISGTLKSNDLRDDDKYFFGTATFNKSTYPDLIDMIQHLYMAKPDTNIIIYNVAAGTLAVESAFGSLSNSGHYITLLINVKEFVENNRIYVIDSVAKNLKGETNHRINYNFTEKPNIRGSRKFTEAFDVSRISEQALEVTGKGKINANTLSLLGIEGGCGVIVCPNNLSKDYEDVITSDKTK